MEKRFERTLRVVGGTEGDELVVDLDEADELVQDRRCLLAEARALNAIHGKNVYSEFLKRNGRRPDPTEARTIGQLMGARVKASDGSMQPPMSSAERRALRQAKVQRRIELERYSRIRRLKIAITDLGQNNADPSELVELLLARLDESPINEHLDSALQWLSRFAEVYNERSKGIA